MFKILAQIFGLTLSIKLKEKQKFVSSWDLAASNSPSNSPNNNNQSYKNLFDNAPINLSSNSTLKSDIQIQEVKPEKNDS